MKTFDLFPTPVGIFQNSNVSEHSFIMSSEFENHKFYDGMVVSKDKNFLNNNLTNIPLVYKFILESLHEYSQQLLATTSELRITQSWLTQHSGIPQQTFPHRHQNSIISGSYYIQATEEDSGISFYRDNDMLEKYIKWEQEPHLVTNNKYAWERVEIQVDTGVLVLFPSYMKHSVNGILKNNTRCALAFNTWFKEPFGNEDAFTLL